MWSRAVAASAGNGATTKVPTARPAIPPKSARRESARRDGARRRLFAARLLLGLTLRQHLDAARTFGGPQRASLFVPDPRFLRVGFNAPDEALGENVRIVCGPHGDRSRRIARVGGSPEEQARGCDVAGIEKRAAALEQKRYVLGIPRRLRGRSGGRLRTA